MNSSIRMYNYYHTCLPWPSYGRPATFQRFSHWDLAHNGPQGKGLAPGGRSRQIYHFSRYSVRGW